MPADRPRSVPIGVGGALTWACAIANGVSPLNGNWPLSSRKKTTPIAYTSRARVDLLAKHLLGRHVGRRAHHESDARQVFGPRHPRDAEVHDLRRHRLR